MIYKATKQDVGWMVALSHQKRVSYEKTQPHFWKMADDSDLIQHNYFLEEISKDSVIALCSNDNLGFIIGKIITPPEVYDTGKTLMIDDFCVVDEKLWINIGKELLQECIRYGKVEGTRQVLTVCGHHDLPKQQLINKLGLTIVSNWFAKTI